MLDDLRREGKLVFSVLNKLKKLFYRLYMSDALRKDDLDIVIEKFGNEYGGFCVCTDYIYEGNI